MHDLDRNDLVFETNVEPGMDGYGNELESPEQLFDGIEQSELASELLAVTDDRELEQFLDNFLSFKRLKSLGGSLLTPLKKKLGGVLKNALPQIASLAGGALGGPAGAMIAKQGASHVGSLLGLELEGLSPEDQEFEAAKQLVTMVGAALENAAREAGNRPNAHAEELANSAVSKAVQRHLPGLARRYARRAPRVQSVQVTHNVQSAPNGATAQGAWTVVRDTGDTLVLKRVRP